MSDPDVNAAAAPGSPEPPVPGMPVPPPAPAPGSGAVPHPPYVERGVIRTPPPSYTVPADVPPAVPPAYAAAPEPRPRSGRAWIWWLVGIAAVLMLCGITSALLVAVDRSGGFNITDGTVAVIPMDGTIAGSGSGASVITPEGFLKQLERAEADDNVKAIVLRVNSPGGTVAASEEIATYVRQATKPVVVSVGDVDASGAYMVSSQADRIIALPGSAVGSIGVIMEVPDASALLDKIGLQFQVITAGKYKDAGSPYRPLTLQEKAMLKGQIDQVYGQFIDIVARGRHLPRSQVETLATGWAWNGDEAKGLGLVDQTGTYKDALKVAAKLGGIKGEYKVDVYNETQPLGSLLSAILGIESQLQGINANLPANPAALRGNTLAK